MGACECDAGWGGADCTRAMRHSSWPPLWLTYVVMLVCLVLSLAALLAARHMLQDFIDRRRQAAEEQSALLVRSHPAPSCCVCACLRKSASPVRCCHAGPAHRG